jgi:hypothetical protein
MQIARTVSKNENVEARGMWSLIRATFPHMGARHFLVSGRFQSRLAHRYLFWEIQHPRDAICFSCEYCMRAQADHQLSSLPLMIFNQEGKSALREQ